MNLKKEIITDNYYKNGCANNYKQKTSKDIKIDMLRAIKSEGYEIPDEAYQKVFNS